jgi:hypothetical protein
VLPAATIYSILKDTTIYDSQALCNGILLVSQMLGQLEHSTLPVAQMPQIPDLLLFSWQVCVIFCHMHQTKLET